MPLQEAAGMGAREWRASGLMWDMVARLPVGASAPAIDLACIAELPSARWPEIRQACLACSRMQAYALTGRTA